MFLKKWTSNYIQEILTFAVLIVCTYSSIFVKHNQIIYLVLSIITIQCVLILTKSQLFKTTTTKTSTSPIVSQIDIIHNTKDLHKWNWLKNDKPLLQMCKKINTIQKFNKPIYHEICKKANNISRKYYKEIFKTDKNIYSNLDKHKQCIQYLEDTGSQITDLLMETEFGTSNKKYMDTYNIPGIITNFQNIIKERVNLLKHKRELC
jgi:hypothetical protein